MVSTVQWRCGVSWGAVVMGNGRCAPRFCHQRVGRWAGLFPLWSVPVVRQRASLFLVFFQFFRREWPKVCRIPSSTIRVGPLIHGFVPLGFWADAWRVYQVDCFPTLLGVVGVVVHCGTLLLFCNTCWTFWFSYRCSPIRLHCISPKLHRDGSRYLDSP